MMARYTVVSSKYIKSFCLAEFRFDSWHVCHVKLLCLINVLSSKFWNNEHTYIFVWIKIDEESWEHADIYGSVLEKDLHKNRNSRNGCQMKKQKTKNVTSFKENLQNCGEQWRIWFGKEKDRLFVKTTKSLQDFSKSRSFRKYCHCFSSRDFDVSFKIKQVWHRASVLEQQV